MSYNRLSMLIPKNSNYCWFQIGKLGPKEGKAPLINHYCLPTRADSAAPKARVSRPLIPQSYAFCCSRRLRPLRVDRPSTVCTKSHPFRCPKSGHSNLVAILGPIWLLPRGFTCLQEGLAPAVIEIGRAQAAAVRPPIVRSSGNVTVTEVPTPTSLSMVRVPPCSSTMVLVSGRPRPVPSYLRSSALSI